MVIKSKAETFIGFAIRARKIREGMNSVQTLKKAELIVCCASASDNTKKAAVKAAAKFECPIIYSKRPLEEIVHRENDKVAAITDKSLAKAVMDSAGEDFTAGI